MPEKKNQNEQVPATDSQYPQRSMDGPETPMPSMAFSGHTPHRGDRTHLEGVPLENNRRFSALLNNQPGTIHDAKARWLRAKKLEFGLRHLLNEHGEPGEDNSITLHFRGIATLLKNSTKTPDAIQEDVTMILQGWQGDGTIAFRSHGDELFHLRYLQTRHEIHVASEQRFKAAELILRHLLRKVKARGLDIRVEFSRNDLETVLSEVVKPGSNQLATIIKRALLTLHETKVLTIQNGTDLFLPSLGSQRRSPEQPRSNECEEPGDGSFYPNHQDFPPRSFHGEKLKSDNPTREESLKRIVGETTSVDQVFALSDDQRAIVTESLVHNIMILAGPGSGKTKTLVHRAAWLVQVKRVPLGSVLIVAFNRSTVLEIRHRLKRLIGPAARQIQVQTYHGLALRISGRSLAITAESRKTVDFEKVMANVVKEATMILERLKGRDRDEMTGGLIGKLKVILVDEYQDVNEDQYRMISLLARKDEPDAAHPVHLLAVGDDDQNIYTWNGADVRFLRQFTASYAAVTHHLLTNYRSSPEIVTRTSSFIRRNVKRMKHDSTMVSSQQGRVAGNREKCSFLATESVDDSHRMIIDEIKRLVERGFSLHEIAILSRLNENVLKLRFLAEEAGFPAAILRKPQVSVLRLREIKRFLDRLKSATRQEPPLEKVAELIQGLRDDSPAGENPWEMLIDSVIEQYFEETSHPSVHDCFHFFMDSVREFRQGETRREGFLSLATMHAAKGLEFPAVIVLLDGAQPNEEDRRLVYVAMTRAKESLSIVSSSACTGLAAEVAEMKDWQFPVGLPPSENGPTLELRGYWPSVAGTPGGKGKARQTLVFELGPRDIHLSWPASLASRQIIDAIAKAEVGTKGKFLQTGDEFRILIEGVPVVRSSKAGAKRLKECQGMTCTDVTCYAILTRSKSDEDSDFLPFIKHETWEYPLFQMSFSSIPQ